MIYWGLAAPVLAAISIVGLTGFLLIRVQPAYARRIKHLAANRMILALSFSLIIAIAIGTVFSATSGSNFQLSGIQRYITAPLIYAAFGIVLLTSTTLISKPPLWALLPALLTAASLIASPLTGDSFKVASLNQGVVLLISVPLLGTVGRLAAEWSGSQQRALLTVLCVAGAAAGVLQLQTGVFSAFVLPTAATLLFLAYRRTPGWPLLAAAGLWVIIANQIQNSEAIDPSAATNGQLIISLGLFGLAVVPVRIRLLVVVSGAIAGLVAALSSPVPGLMLGIGADLEDVTLAQRAYETQQVLAQAEAHPLALLVGGGPGATVNLEGSPDSLTLAGSGRDLAAVPSVHLLTTYILLKLGLAGIIWFGIFLVAVARIAFQILSARRPETLQVVLLVFIVAGVVQALPAATFLFSNPLPALFLGVLSVLLHKRPAPPPPSQRLGSPSAFGMSTISTTSPREGLR